MSKCDPRSLLQFARQGAGWALGSPILSGGGHEVSRMHELLLLKRWTIDLSWASVSPEKTGCPGATTICPHTDDFVLIFATSKSKRRAVSLRSTSAYLFVERWECQDIDAISWYLCLVSFLSKTCSLIYSLQYCTFCTDQSCRTWKNIYNLGH